MCSLLFPGQTLAFLAPSNSNMLSFINEKRRQGGSRYFDHVSSPKMTLVLDTTFFSYILLVSCVILSVELLRILTFGAIYS
jgi:hypothetical protein